MKPAISTVTPQALTVQADVNEVIKAFATAQDVKPSSRTIYARIMRDFFGWVASTGRTASALTLADVIAYKEGLLAADKSALTVASHINALRRFYEWAEANKYYPNIAKGVHAPKRRNDEFKHKPLSVSKVAELLRYAQATNARDYAIITLMLYTGLRCVEVSRANIEDITYIGENNTRVLMVQGKGHDTKDDWVRLTNDAYKPIAEYLATRKGENGKQPLFVSTSNHTGNADNHTGEQDFNPRRLSTRAISALCKEALKAVGLDNKVFTAHSLRHTAGTNILRAGGSLEQAQQTLRHSNPATTQIYVKMALKERRLTDGGETLLDNLYRSARAQPQRSF